MAIRDPRPCTICSVSRCSAISSPTGSTRSAWTGPTSGRRRIPPVPANAARMIARSDAGSGARPLRRSPLQRAREGAAVEQDVLPGDEAGLGAAQEGAGQPKLFRIAETAGGILLGALGQKLVR